MLLKRHCGSGAHTHGATMRAIGSQVRRAEAFYAAMPFEKNKNPKCQAAGAKGGRPRRGAHAAAAADAEQPPALESNDEVDLDDSTDDPVGRRIDDVLTTAQTFDVAGFGKVRSLWPAHPCFHTVQSHLMTYHRKHHQYWINVLEFERFAGRRAYFKGT